MAILRVSQATKRYNVLETPQDALLFQTYLPASLMKQTNHFAIDYPPIATHY